MANRVKPVGVALLMAMGFLGEALAGAKYYVAPAGDDANAGSQSMPFASMAKGQSVAVGGDTVFFRGGNYAISSSTAEIAITLSNSGSAGNRIHYFAYPGEVPVFDFKGMTALKRIKGLLVTGSWLHIKGIEMKNVPQSDANKAHEDWCVYVDGGSNNIFEALNLHHNMGPGFFIQNGGNNLVLNCDSHDNYDPYSYAKTTLSTGEIVYTLTPGENADGFGCHVKATTGSGNVFRGCRAWFNADDGWDFINCLASVTVENCWSWGNGYKSGTNPPQATGNGNGFKLGGFGNPPAGVPDPVPQHTVRFCLAFNNLAAGFYQNHHPIANFYYNNTSFNNKAANYNLLGYNNGDASLGILRNNIAFTGKDLSNNTLGGGVDAANNSWNLSSLTVSSADFAGIDTAGVYAPRKSDGSLPAISFMQLKTGSDLIDKGVDVKLAFNGKSPDLGAFESGTPTVILNGRKPRASLVASQAIDIGGYDARGRRMRTFLPGPGHHRAGGTVLLIPETGPKN
ncbi:MAG: right-handed parallel beta-helix repeat-containing protein [Fibrobacteria bacterium]